MWKIRGYGNAPAAAFATLLTCVIGCSASPSANNTSQLTNTAKPNSSASATASASAAASGSTAPSGPALVRTAHVAGPKADAANAIVAAEDRTADDRKNDARRHPAELLTFLGIAPGMRVADLGAGSGYTTELLMRAVGTSGKVFAQNNAYTLERFVSEKWPARLQRDVMKGAVRVDREYNDPLPAEASELDLVTIIFSYHDVVAQGHSTKKLNAAVFRSLKAGGHYVVADHTAKAGSGLGVAKELHRIEETVVRKQVEAAGFQFVEDAQFLRDSSDKLGVASFKIGFDTDRFILKFRKPE